MNLGVGHEAPDQYGVAGHPVAHSWSPFIHGMFAKATAQNLVYRLFDIPPDNFRGEALRLFASGVRGLNVTLPHKQAAAELVNELTPRAFRAQAVNTIAFFDDTSLLGDNTDGLGLTADLERNLGVTLTGKRVLILGAGGAVRGVLGPLLERDLREVVIANRTPERARKLATEFEDLGSIRACGFSEVRGPPYDLIINATSASLHGEMPVMPVGLVSEESICYDMAYGRGHTPFTLWAKSLHAARTSKGWGMLVEQAAESFQLWRGIRPDTKPVLQALVQHT
ncbi:MAG: shikimate dehydrogenase [Gammaproteobacteria bacterium]|nr:shikimate dehydrogenase [Gammaproteobacteria bacterium]